MGIKNIYAVEINNETRKFLDEMLHKWVDYILKEGERLVFVDGEDNFREHMSVEIHFPIKDREWKMEGE